MTCGIPSNHHVCDSVSHFDIIPCPLHPTQASIADI